MALRKAFIGTKSFKLRTLRLRVTQAGVKQGYTRKKKKYQPHFMVLVLFL